SPAAARPATSMAKLRAWRAGRSTLGTCGFAGWRWMAPPIASRCSARTTGTPASARASAAPSPAGPAPTTRTGAAGTVAPPPRRAEAHAVDGRRQAGLDDAQPLDRHGASLAGADAAEDARGPAGRPAEVAKPGRQQRRGQRLAFVEGHAP